MAVETDDITVALNYQAMSNSVWAEILDRSESDVPAPGIALEARKHLAYTSLYSYDISQRYQPPENDLHKALYQSLSTLVLAVSIACN
jgi:hypothetical protein